MAHSPVRMCPCSGSPQPCPLHGLWTTGHSPEHSTAAIPTVTWPWPQARCVLGLGIQTEYGLRTVQGQHEGGEALP